MEHTDHASGHARRWWLLTLLGASTLAGSALWRTVSTRAGPAHAEAGLSAAASSEDAALLRALGRYSREPFDQRDETAVVRMITLLAESDPLAAAQHTERWLRPPARERTLRVVISQWAATAPDAALRWISTHTDATIRDTALRALMPVLVRQDSDAAAQLLAALDVSPLQDDLLRQGLASLAGTDLSLATAWAGHVPPHLKERAQAHLCQLGTQTDPAATAAYAEALPQGASRIRNLATIAGQWSHADPAAAIAWADRLSDAPSRHQALVSATAAWAESDPPAAAEFASTLPAGATQREIIISAVSAWALRDPAQAASWVGSLPAGATRNYAIKTIAAQWARWDSSATGAWLVALPSGRERDAGLHAAAAGLLETQPEVAARWSSAIADSALRHAQLERTARRWLELDPAAARAWLAQSDLPVERITALDRD